MDRVKTSCGAIVAILSAVCGCKGNSEAVAAQAVAEEARDQATQARRMAAQAQAPAKVSVAQLGCECAPGKRIVVTCHVKSAADVPVEVEVGAAAQTGIVGVRSAGATTVSVAAHSDAVAQVETTFSGLTDCSAAKACSCSKARVTAQ